MQVGNSRLSAIVDNLMKAYVETADANDSTGDGKEYPVSQIIGRRTGPEGVLYLVTWEGCASSSALNTLPRCFCY